MTSPWQSVSVMLSRFIGELCCMLGSVLNRMELPSIEVDSLISTSYFSSKQGNGSFKFKRFYTSPKPLLSDHENSDIYNYV